MEAFNWHDWWGTIVRSVANPERCKCCSGTCRQMSFWPLTRRWTAVFTGLDRHVAITERIIRSWFDCAVAMTGIQGRGASTSDQDGGRRRVDLHAPNVDNVDNLGHEEGGTACESLWMRGTVVSYQWRGNEFNYVRCTWGQCQILHLHGALSIWIENFTFA